MVKIALYDYGRVIIRTKKENAKSYTLNFKTNKHLTRKIMNRADYDIHSGMIEEVLPNYIAYHDLDRRDIGDALNLIAKYFGSTIVTVEEEHHIGCYCHYEFIVAVQL